MAWDKEIAARLLARGNAGRFVRLTPGTAIRVGAALMRSSEKPTRDEIAMLICGVKCSSPCYGCKAKANLVVAAYGCRAD